MDRIKLQVIYQSREKEKEDIEHEIMKEKSLTEDDADMEMASRYWWEHDDNPQVSYIMINPELIELIEYIDERLSKIFVPKHYRSYYVLKNARELHKLLEAYEGTYSKAGSSCDCEDCRSPQIS